MKKILYALALVLAAVGAQAQTAFPLFQPSNGIMKGDVNTFVTTSAVGSDVTSLFSGTCNAAAFLRGDASCFDLLGGANSWTGLNTWTQNMSQFKADPRFCQYDSGSDATWFWRMSTDILRLQVVDSTVCTTTGSAIPITISVAGGVTSSLSLAATGINLTGAITLNGLTSVTSDLTSLSSVPRVITNETGAPLNEKIYDYKLTAGALAYRTRTDADGAGATWLTVDRTGTVVDSIAFAGTALTFNGNPLSTAVGANPSVSVGLATVNGAATTFMRSDAAPALSQGIAPTWTNNHLFTAVGSGLTWPIVLQSNQPGVMWHESDATADNSNWRFFAGGEQLRLDVTNDVAGVSNPIMLVDRTGVTVDSIALTSTALTWNGSPISTSVGANPSASLGLAAVNGAATTFMRSDAAPALSVAIAPTWTGAHIFSNAAAIKATGTLGLEIENAAPVEVLDETDAPANERTWLTRMVAGDWFISTATDAAPTTAVNNALAFTRTGTTIDSVAVAATAFTFNGNPVSTAASANPTASVGLAAVNGAATTFMRSDGAPPIDQAIAPTWTGAHVFSNAAAIKATGTVGIEVESAAPIQVVDETDAPANERSWIQKSVAGDMFFSTATDAAPSTPVNNALGFTRTGTTVDSVAVTSTAFTFNGNPVSTAVSANPTGTVGLATVNGSAATFLRSDGAPPLSQSIAPTWTGAHIFSNAAAIKATGTIGLELENAAPIQVADETDAAADERSWLYRSSAGALAISTATDASPNVAVANALVIDRTGTTVDSFAVTATAATVNGQNICRADGTGCPAALGETSGTDAMTVTAGCTTTPAVSGTWRKIGTVIVLRIPTTSCTANAATFTIGNLAVANRPTNQQGFAGGFSCAGTGLVEQIAITTGGAITVLRPTNCPAGTANLGQLTLTYSTAL